MSAFLVRRYVLLRVLALTLLLCPGFLELGVCQDGAVPTPGGGVFVRGDCDADELISLGDPVHLLFFVFGGGVEPSCLDACDINDDEGLDITDVLAVLRFLFLDGPPPAPPVAFEDVDPEGSDLGCANGREPPLDLLVSPSELVFYRVGNREALKVLGVGENGASGSPGGPPEATLQDLRTAASTAYTSSAPDVCSVGEDGIVTAIAAGEATIEVRHRGLLRQVQARVVSNADQSPRVEWLAPGDGVVVTAARIEVVAVVEPPTAQVRLNGVVVAISEGILAVDVELVPGPNRFEVVATNASGETRTTLLVERVEPGDAAAIAADGLPLPVVPPPLSRANLMRHDTTAPVVVVTFPASGQTLFDNAVTVRGTVDDPTAEVVVGGVPARRTPSGFEATLELDAAASSLLVEAIDPAGNRNETLVDFTLDTRVPRLTLETLNGGTGSLVASFPLRLQGTVDPADSRVFVGAQAAHVVASPSGAIWSTAVSLAPGPHDLVVTAEVSGPVPRRARLVRSLVVDAEPPEVDLAYPPQERLLTAAGHRVQSGAVVFSGRVFEGAGVPRDLEGLLRLSIGGVEADISGGTFRVEVPLAEALNVVQLKAVDARGLVLEQSYTLARGGPASPVLLVDSGDLQVVPAGVPFRQPLVVRAVNPFFQSDRDVDLEFRVVQGDARFVDGSRLLQRSSGVDGRASVEIVAGAQAGSGAVVVTVSAEGRANSPVAFTLDVSPAARPVLTAAGSRHVVAEAGHDLVPPPAVRLLDVFGNPIAGAAVNFRVLSGEARLDGGAGDVVAVTDAMGRATVGLALPAGVDSESVLEAAFADTNDVHFRVTGLRPGAVAATRLSGLVLDERGVPIEGAIVWLDDGSLLSPDAAASLFSEVTPYPSIAAFTDGAGEFALEGVPAGEVLVRAAVSYDDASWVEATQRVGTIAGRENVAVAALVLPSTASSARAQSRYVTPVTGLLLTLPALPGLRLEALPGAATFPDGSSSGQVTLVAPPRGALPAAPPDDTFAALPYVILPAGVRFDPPARLVLPHVALPAEGSEEAVLASRPAGSRPSLFAYRGGAAGFVELPGGTVDESGALLRLEGVLGVTQGGWYFSAPRGPSGGETATLAGTIPTVLPDVQEVPQRAKSAVVGLDVYSPLKKSDLRESVLPAGLFVASTPAETPSFSPRSSSSTGCYLHSGEFFVDAVDLEIPGRGLSFRFRRSYESRHAFRGSLGHNWEHEYEDRRLFAGRAPGNIVRATGRGGFDEYLRNHASGRFVAPIGIFAQLFVDGDGFFVEREADGTRYVYHPLDGTLMAGRLTVIRDRDDNELRMERGPDGRIDQVRDTLGRRVTYEHDEEGRIASVTDFTGRVVRFAYDAAGDLVAVTGAQIVGTPTDNNFPEGRRTEYVYDSGFGDARLDHNLVAILDPREVDGTRTPRLRLEYDRDPSSPAFDRVVRQIHGGTNATGVDAGGPSTYDYQFFRSPREVGDDVDAIEADLLGAAGRTVWKDAAGREREVTWSGAGLPLSERLWTRDDGIRVPAMATLGASAPTLPPYYETRWRWNREGLLVEEIRPRGDRTVRSYDEDAPLRVAQCGLLRLEEHPVPGAAVPPVVTTYRRDPLFGEAVEEGTGPLSAAQRILDYQEGSDVAGLASAAGVEPARLEEALTRAGIALGLGDVNGSGESANRFGRVVRESRERTVLGADVSVAGAIESLETISTYNRRGQLISRRDADGRVERFEYHPEADPDGDGKPTPGVELRTGGGGYLAARILAWDDGGKVEPIVTRFRYDAWGYPAEITDPRGNLTTLTHNALGELVEWKLPPPLKYRRQFFYDADGNLVGERNENLAALVSGGHFLVPENRWLEASADYDLLGRPVTLVEEVSGGEVGPERNLIRRFRYSPSGRLARILYDDSASDEALFYDERDLLIQHTRGVGNPAEAARTFLRDANGNVVFEIDAADSDGDGEREATERRYDGFNRLVAVIDAAGGARLFERDAAGLVVEESFLGSSGGLTAGSATEGTASSPAGSVLLERQTWRRDELGDVVESERAVFTVAAGTGASPDVARQRFWRDAQGRIVRREDASGGAWSTEYDAAGRATLELDPYGGRRELERDASGNVVRETRIDFTPEPIQPEAAGDPEFDDSGRFREVRTLLRIFDPLHRLTVLVDPQGGVWRLRYDSSDRRIFVSDATGTGIAAETDPELEPLLEAMTPRQLTQLNDHGNRRRYVYDNLGRLVEAHHELRQGGRGGGAIDFTDPFVRDGIITERFEWDDQHRLVAWTTETGEITRVEYDGAGYPIRKTWPGGAQERYSRDRDGNLLTLTDALGSVIHQRFDPLHRVVERSIARASSVQGTTLQRFAYDGLSRLIWSFDNNDPQDSLDDSTVTRRHDSLGNTLLEMQAGFPVRSHYDIQSHRVGLDYPQGRVVETPRDAAGRITRILDRSCEYVAYDYFGSGAERHKEFWVGLALSRLALDPAGVLRNVGYEETGDILEQKYRDSNGNLIVGFEYERDRSGLRIFEHPLHDSRDDADIWRFDSLYRQRTYIPDVFDARAPPADPLRRTNYFPDGNHSWKVIEENFVQRPYSVNERSQYVAIAGDPLTYDAGGQLVDWDGRTYVYDALRRLVEVRTGNEVVARYAYDAVGSEAAEAFRNTGRRVLKDVLRPADGQAAGRVRFFYCDHRVIEERTGGDELLRQYIYGAHDEPEVLIVYPADASPRRFAFLENALGSTVALVEEGGALRESVRYDSLGKPQIISIFNVPLDASTVGNGFLATGAYFDAEIGAALTGARTYHPALGRYLSERAELLPVAPLELNPYLGPAVEAVAGEVTGGGSVRRNAAYLERFRVSLEPCLQAGPSGLPRLRAPRDVVEGEP